jgi:hypothetical protein
MPCGKEVSTFVHVFLHDFMPQVSQDSWVSTAMDSRLVVKFVDTPKGKGVVGVEDDEERARKEEEARQAARKKKKAGYEKDRRKRQKEMKLAQLPRQLLAENGFVVCEAPVELQGDDLKAKMISLSAQAGSFYSFQPTSAPVDLGRGLGKITGDEWGEYKSVIERRLQKLVGEKLWQVDTEGMSVLYTVYPNGVPQLFHTDCPWTVGHKRVSCIVAGSGEFTLLHSPGMWEKVKEARQESETSEWGWSAVDQAVLLRQEVETVVVKEGEMILFKGDWPHAGGTGGRNFRWFVPFGDVEALKQWKEESSNNKEGEVYNVSDLNCETVLKLHTAWHQGPQAKVRGKKNTLIDQALKDLHQWRRE